MTSRILDVYCGMSKEFVYVISPVRQVTEGQAEEITRHVEFLHGQGTRVFNPIEDAPQDDATGYNIVMAELGFMYKAAQEGGRVDILWNMGGKPSEGSRVDVGMAISLGLQLNLITVFNEENPVGPQETYRIIQNAGQKMPRLQKMFEEIEQTGEAIIDWNVEMGGEEQEWQRIRLGLALGCMARNPSFKIKTGKLTGIDPPDKKSYPKVVREIEKRAKGFRNIDTINSMTDEHDRLTAFLMRVVSEFESGKDPLVVELADAAKNLLGKLNPEEKKELLNISGDLGGGSIQSFLEGHLKEILSEEEWEKIDKEERRRHLADDIYRVGVAG